MGPALPQNLDHGYCSTVHSAQGKTCDRVLIEADTKSLTSAQDNYYVAISRARHEAKIYTNDRGRLPEMMAREHLREAALEIQPPPQAKVYSNWKNSKLSSGPEMEI